VVIHQDARVYAALLDGSDAVAHPLGTGRRAYVHVARGSVRVNGRTLQAGDAAKISDETAVTLDAATDAEILLFDLP